MRGIDFEVIVSSPFLRCLQTALILAEKFDAKVLIDQELGEVMGPPVFETKPPLPPRPWRNLTLDGEFGSLVSPCFLDFFKIKF